MSEFIQVAVQQALQNSALEIAAVILGVVYLLLAMRENIWCWAAAFVSTAIFLKVFWDVNLYMESALQVYYLGMAIFGWYQWRHGSNQQSSIAISRWSSTKHGITLCLVIALSLSSGFALETYTDARFPYLDSLTTWGAIITTYMVARKILENWIYWFFIDALSIYLYLDRELYFTAILFAVYLVIVIFGYVTWNQRYLKQSPE